MDKEGAAVEGVLTVAGFNFAGTGQNSGLLFIKLKDWSLRKDKSLGVEAVAQRATTLLPVGERGEYPRHRTSGGDGAG